MRCIENRILGLYEIQLPVKPPWIQFLVPKEVFVYVQFSVSHIVRQNIRLSRMVRNFFVKLFLRLCQQLFCRLDELDHKVLLFPSLVEAHQRKGYQFICLIDIFVCTDPIKLALSNPELGVSDAIGIPILLFAPTQGPLIEHESILLILSYAVTVQVHIAQFVQAIRVIMEQRAEGKILIGFLVVDILMLSVIETIPAAADCRNQPCVGRYLIKFIRLLMVLLHSLSGIIKLTKPQSSFRHIVF